MTKARIFYHSLPDDMRRREKLDWFQENKFDKIPFTHLLPDEKHNWINMVDNDFETLLDLSQVFEAVFPGVNTAKDDWVFGFDKNLLRKKVQFFIEQYNQLLDKDDNSFPGIT